MMSSIRNLLTLPVLVALALGAATGCRSKGPGSAHATSVQNIGSDTMLNLAQAWAEAYKNVEPGVSIEVSGGGSGVGATALVNGTADIANCSRKIEPGEAEKVHAKFNAEPKEFLVGFDALSIFVHKDNPINEISLEELSEIYKDGGKIKNWRDLGVEKIPGSRGDVIVVVSRQNNSGTYQYFRETVAGKKADFRLGTVDLNGSKDLVEAITRSPNAIGYSGAGYATSGVKVLRISKKKGEPGVAPSVDTTLDKSYPISRPMFMYTAGEPKPHVKKYLDWILSDAGQRLVEQTGYVPLRRLNP